MEHLWLTGLDVYDLMEGQSKLLFRLEVCSKNWVGHYGMGGALMA